MRYLKYFLLFLLVIFLFSCSGGGSSTADKEDSAPEISIENIKKMKADPKIENINILKKVISTSKNKKLKEQAVLTLTDISIKNDYVSNTITYLESIVEKDKELTSVINASLDLLRENIPKPLKIDIAINNPIKAGGWININFLFTATKPSQVYILLKSKISLPNKSMSENIEVDNYGEFIDLREKEPRTAKYKLKIKKEGTYGLKFIILQKTTKFETYKYEKYILLDVRKNTGLYKIY